ncbi:hypothetical protein EDB86DRAFT_2834217 [Lactarius hatsudake]|nr:hypothetical protein EDB86DRAFT_2834217 [Lactarius hatsudake]
MALSGGRGRSRERGGCSGEARPAAFAWSCRSACRDRDAVGEEAQFSGCMGGVDCVAGKAGVQQMGTATQGMQQKEEERGRDQAVGKARQTEQYRYASVGGLAGALTGCGAIEIALVWKGGRVRTGLACCGQCMARCPICQHLKHLPSFWHCA